MSDWRVLITRPEPQASHWQQLLSDAGWASAVVPVMAIVAVSDRAAREQIKQQVLNFDRYDKAVFVSRNAVSHACQWLDMYWPQLPADMQYFAVGSATAQQLSQADINVTALRGEDSAMNSEALLAAPSLQQVAGDKVIIFRGVGGRNLFAQTLRERGAEVDFCQLYHRQLPAEAEAQLLQALAPEARRHDILSVHSGESLQLLMQLLQAHPALADYARGRPLLLPGERVAALAREAGFQDLLVAHNASDKSMIATLKSYTNKL